MRRFAFRIGVLLLTFAVGVVATGVVKRVFSRRQRLLVYSNCLQTRNLPRFISEGSLLERDYQIHRFRTPASDDREQIVLFNDFRSAEVTRELFESNSTTSAATLIERGDKFDAHGHKLGKRGVTIFKDGNVARIFWTDGDVFWSVQAPSLELAREFEKSAIVQAIIDKNKDELAGKF